MKRFTISAAVALLFAASVQAQQVTTVTRYVYTQPPQPVVTEYVYVQPPAPRISLGEVILGAAIIYGVHEISHSHHSYHPKLISAPSRDSQRLNHSRSRQMPIRNHHR